MGVNFDDKKNIFQQDFDPKYSSEYVKLMKELNPEEIKFIQDRNPIVFFKKGTILLREEEISDKCYYIFEGCVRQYIIKDGIEKTTFFYTEDQAISTFSSTSHNVPSKYYLECMEDCNLSVTSYTSEKEVYKRFPKLESVCRKETEKELGKFQEMLSTYITTSPEERYLNLLKNRPTLLNRVPQHQIASYLGVKPESLSRIRKRISLK